jgi:hypothetical protein
MAATPIIHIGENSPEQVAYKLFVHIARLERQDLYPSEGKQGPDRKWVLDTYAECLRSVKGRRRFPRRA